MSKEVRSSKCTALFCHICLCKTNKYGKIRFLEWRISSWPWFQWKGTLCITRYWYVDKRWAFSWNMVHIIVDHWSDKITSSYNPVLTLAYWLTLDNFRSLMNGQHVERLNKQHCQVTSFRYENWMLGSFWKGGVGQTTTHRQKTTGVQDRRKWL